MQSSKVPADMVPAKGAAPACDVKPVCSAVPAFAAAFIEGAVLGGASALGAVSAGIAASAASSSLLFPPLLQACSARDGYRTRSCSATSGVITGCVPSMATSAHRHLLLEPKLSILSRVGWSSISKTPFDQSDQSAKRHLMVRTPQPNSGVSAPKAVQTPGCRSNSLPGASPPVSTILQRTMTPPYMISTYLPRRSM